MVRKSTLTGSVKDLLGVVLILNTGIWGLLSLIFFYPSLEITKTSLTAFIVAGGTGFFMGYILLFSSIERVGASRATPLIRIQVLIAMSLSLFLLKETLSSFHLLGVFIILAGAGLVSKEISQNSSDSHPDNVISLDLAFPLLAAVTWGTNQFFTKIGLMQGTPVTVGLAISSLSGLFGYLFWHTVTRKRLPLLDLNSENKLWYTATAAVCAIAFLLYYLAFAFSRIVVVSPIWQISPLFVLILSYLFLPHLEKITRRLVTGAVLIVGGAVIVVFFM